MNYLKKYFLLSLILLLTVNFTETTSAKNSNEIDASIESALARFSEEVQGSQGYLDGARGILVIPRMIKAGVVLGMEYGEGALIVDDIKAVSYTHLTLPTKRIV